MSNKNAGMYHLIRWYDIQQGQVMGERDLVIGLSRMQPAYVPLILKEAYWKFRKSSTRRRTAHVKEYLFGRLILTLA